ncbi:MAG TPA: aspartate aminotransferase family protein [Syntrophales bacterium]|jgi:acetylornithine aminotransferase/acetylornithine/N-succinyldiaminopimelate aminotransferase|nr:aspartate aminotransferase family protein [Syntrophales bacterium]HON23576.1 aspartate aminotransferase family protein [Syntrophales bacterium]HOU76616.1 aspartate aminotransferase family protein [Syntrophales bacterium]HPC31373.1 aspartate aminotransferase family protein [Syntrophales bacterium]HQG33279.1 aspartate aminotransferase family protein [Syntrophales bacterium]
MNEKELINIADQYIMGTYRRFPVVFTRGKGMNLWDTEGREYLDFVAGIAVCSLGHAHPAVTEAIRNQAEKLLHVSNLYYIEAQIEYARLLAANCVLKKIFFCNSGAEANEGAIKLARKFGNENSGGLKNEIITMAGSFHGRTMATITATGQEKFRKDFHPLLPGFKYAPFNDLETLEKMITPETCAVMVEPIQAEGGIRVPAPGYFPGLRRLCDERKILLILDEVQVGMGRTGTLFAYEHEGIVPDIITMAKAMGNGFPLGAVLAREDVAAAFTPGSHASTFGGNPLAMAAARATLEVMIDGGVLAGCRARGAYLQAKLEGLRTRYPLLREVRGRGLLVGVETEREVGDIIAGAMKKGLLIAQAGPHVLRFVPPLIVSDGDIERAVAILEAVLQEMV